MVQLMEEVISIAVSAKAIGSPAGERLLEAALNLVSEAATEEAGAVIALDLAKVRLATTSFIKAGPLPLFLAGQRYADQSGNGLDAGSGSPALNVYPVFCNVDDEVLDTMSEIFSGRRLPFIVGEMRNGELKNGRIFGFLDEALVRTIRLIRGRDLVTALQLASDFPGENIKPTGWNNRLNDLW